jgi:hypothetical protein
MNAMPILLQDECEARRATAGVVRLLPENKCLLRLIFDRDEVTTKSRRVGCAPKAEENRGIGIGHDGPWRVDDAARRVIQAFRGD